MLLKSLKLENIRSHKNTTLQFPQGSMLLAGDIGSGKSSLLFALEFALFGIQQGLSGTSLLRHGAKQGSVEVCFGLPHINGDIIVKRNLKRGKQSVSQEAGFVIQNGTKTDATAVELKTKIHEFLGYPLSLVSKSKSLLYRYTIYTPQEEMKAILMQDSETRLNILRKVFGIDKYKRIKDNSALYAKTLRADMRVMKAKIEDLSVKKETLGQEQEKKKQIIEQRENKEKQVQTNQQLVEEAKKQLAVLEKDVKQYQEIKKQQEIDIAKIQEKNKRIVQQQDEIIVTQKALEAVEKKIDFLNIDDKMQEQGKEQIEQNIQEKEQQLLLFQKQQTRCTEQLQALEKVLQQLRLEVSQKEELLVQLEEKKKTLTELQQKISSLPGLRTQQEALAQELQHVLVGIKETEILIQQAQQRQQNMDKLNECPTCLQRVPETHKHKIKDTETTKITHYQQKITTLKDAQERKQRVHGQMQEELQELQEQEKKIAQLSAEIMHGEKNKLELNEKKARQEQYEEEKKVLERKLEELKQTDNAALQQIINDKKEVLKKIIELEHVLTLKKDKQIIIDKLKQNNDLLAKEVEILAEQKKKTEEDLVRLADVVDKEAKQKQILDQAYQELKEKELALRGLQKEQEAIQRMVDLLNQEVETKEATKAKIVKTQQIHDWLEKYLQNLVVVIEKNVMFKIYQYFNELFKEWFTMLIEDELLQVSLQEDFSIVVMQNGYETDLHFLSGGEKTAVALAYRLALNKVINDVVSTINTKNLIILDEPTDGFSAEQLDKMRDVLDQLNMQQIILVSHENKIESFVDHVVRIGKSEHVSRVV